MRIYVLLVLVATLGTTTRAATTTATTTTTTSSLSPPPPPPPPESPSPTDTATTTDTADADASSPPSNALPTPPGTGDTGGSGQGGRPPPPPPLPVWVQCLSEVPGGASLPELFSFWCSNYNKIVPCIAAGLPTEISHNPLDQFVQLHFDAEEMTNRSAQLCANFRGISSRVQCTQQNNASVERWCHDRFSQGQQYVFAVRSQRAFDNDVNVYRELACQVINDTTGCLGLAMTGCDVEVKRHLLAFYAFFTNESCVADPTAEFTLPEPPPPRPAPPRDVVITCAQQVAENFTPAPPSQNASQLDQLLYGVRQNCRTFEARYNCYDEELNKISSPSFRDIWLRFTFDSENAIRSQTQFCEAFEGGIADSLNEACYKATQPLLQQCEEEYGQSVVSIQDQWLNDKLDNIDLHKAACRTSLERAQCLKDAFTKCGETLAVAMYESEKGTLPRICLSLLPQNNTTTMDQNSASAPTTATEDGNDNSLEPAAELEPDGNSAPDSDSSMSSSPDGEKNTDEEKPSVQSDGSTAANMDDGKGSLASLCLGSSLLVVVFSGVISLFLLV
ncbi:uncharacterized protein LOC143299111 [Babylonia areolata]|uniref:uncharacterized protein LOC143299111 n=1 Tax=Babylonia areolata TaxID=304850 RepID=UPI003FD416A4